MNTRPRIHLAECDYCGRRIAWSRKRRQWLVLYPFTWMKGTQLQRRLRCPQSPTGEFHDPSNNLSTSVSRELDVIFGRAR